METNKETMANALGINIVNTTSENNKLIAKFMGIYHYRRGVYEMFVFEDDNHRTEIDLYYHSDWNWLMEVIEFIESSPRFDVQILQYGAIILDEQVEVVNNVADFSFSCKIEHTYDAVVKFIKWYNDNN